MWWSAAQVPHQGTVLSPFLFTLYTSDFTYSTDSFHQQNFSDYIAIVGCVSEGNDCEYRKLIMDFVDWCELNHLQVNASKTKEMVIDFSRKPSSEIAPVNIQGLDIERVRTYKPLLRTFYETVVASVVSYAVVCWGGGCSERDKKRLNRLIKRASSVCGCPLDSIEVMGERRALAKLSTIMDNTSHPLHQTVGALSSSFSNRLRHPRCRKELPQVSLMPWLCFRSLDCGGEEMAGVDAGCPFYHLHICVVGEEDLDQSVPALSLPVLSLEAFHHDKVSWLQGVQGLGGRRMQGSCYLLSDARQGTGEVNTVG
ncbi:hypothetical protein L3Q82_003318 [Scortum barcoo]|uniref:Uncharacterized protein n=1 Tax=Scortum barcoo TaxID=214431 RepID=A0ACB8VML9_9TELE|nr:hypothetical protein L3Q82_003318 [Scortum barcoo]